MQKSGSCAPCEACGETRSQTPRDLPTTLQSWQKGALACSSDRRDRPAGSCPIRALSCVKMSGKPPRCFECAKPISGAAFNQKPVPSAHRDNEARKGKLIPLDVCVHEKCGAVMKKRTRQEVDESGPARGLRKNGPPPPQPRPSTGGWTSSGVAAAVEQLSPRRSGTRAKAESPVPADGRPTDERPGEGRRGETTRSPPTVEKENAVAQPAARRTCAPD